MSIKLGSFADLCDDYSLMQIVDNTDNGRCSSCGECCSNMLPLSDIEKKRIHLYIKANDIKEQRHVYPTVNPVFDMTCPFRDELNRKCLIYSIRPEICRRFICNRPEKAERDKVELYAHRAATMMRQEFYGSEEGVMEVLIKCLG